MKKKTRETYEHLLDNQQNLCEFLSSLTLQRYHTQLSFPAQKLAVSLSERTTKRLSTARETQQNMAMARLVPQHHENTVNNDPHNNEYKHPTA